MATTPISSFFVDVLGGGPESRTKAPKQSAKRSRGETSSTEQRRRSRFEGSWDRETESWTVISVSINHCSYRHYSICDSLGIYCSKFLSLNRTIAADRVRMEQLATYYRESFAALNVDSVIKAVLQKLEVDPLRSFVSRFMDIERSEQLGSSCDPQVKSSLQ